MSAAAPVILEEEKRKEAVLLSHSQYLSKENLFITLSVGLWCGHNGVELDSNLRGKPEKHNWSQ